MLREPGPRGTGPLQRAGVGRHRDGRKGAAGAAAPADRRQQPVAVGDRHGDIGEDHVGPPRLEDLNRFRRRPGDPRLGAGAAQDVAEQLAPVGLVVDREDAQAGERGHGRGLRRVTGRGRGLAMLGGSVGSVTVNIEPFPGPSLCAVPGRRARPR